MNLKGIFFALTLGFLAISAEAIDFSRVNVSWQYDLDSRLRMMHRVVSNSEGVSIFLRIDADSLVAWNFEFLVQNGYESETHRSILPEGIDTLSILDDLLFLKLTLPQLEENLLVVKAQESQFYYYDIGLKIGSLSFPSIYPVNEVGLPILENFINRSGFKWQGSQSFHVMKYREAFQIPDPPMAQMKPLAPSADLDSTFVFQDSVAFEDDYFFVVRNDSNASTGVTILRMPPYFPEYRKLAELAESLLYITSEPEKKALLNSKNLKQSFDSFWMNNFNTKSRARNAIRNYYRWVEESNILFTDYKPGWKTDRGMMYMIFGKPAEVYRTGTQEEWYYENGESFEFTIISSFFAARTYALRRNKDLEVPWFQRIASFRRGINE